MNILVRIAGTAMIMALGLPAQPAEASRKFEVASIKRAVLDGKVTPCLCEPGGRVAYRQSLLRLIIQRAYNLQARQVEGPDWLDSERFDIDARLPEGASSKDVPTALQVLLAERFKLSAHNVTRVVPSFVLVVGKSGSKMPLNNEAVAYSSREDRAGKHLRQKMNMANLTNFLSIQLGSPVMDETGLAGLFTIVLDYAPEYLNSRAGAAPGAPPLAVAVQEQLGLQLEPRRSPLEFLVIDHMERVATEN